MAMFRLAAALRSAGSNSAHRFGSKAVIWAVQPSTPGNTKPRSVGSPDSEHADPGAPLNSCLSDDLSIGGKSPGGSKNRIWARNDQAASNTSRTLQGSFVAVSDNPRHPGLTPLKKSGRTARRRCVGWSTLRTQPCCGLNPFTQDARCATHPPMQRASAIVNANGSDTLSSTGQGSIRQSRSHVRPSATGDSCHHGSIGSAMIVRSIRLAWCSDSNGNRCSRLTDLGRSRVAADAAPLSPG